MLLRKGGELVKVVNLGFDLAFTHDVLFLFTLAFMCQIKILYCLVQNPCF